MKTFIRTALATAALAAAGLASAATVTLDFEDLNPAGGWFDLAYPGGYKGYNFTNASGNPLLAGTNGSWFWGPATAPLAYAGAVNIGSAFTGLDEWTVISHTSLPFKLQQMLFIGDICCGSALPIGIQLIDKNNNLIDVGAFNSTTLGTPGQTFGLPGPTNGGTFDILKNGFEPVPGNGFIYTFTNPLPNLELKGIALYGFAGYYAVDNIVVTAVPEPSAYAMFAVGLGVLGFAARRRQQKANQAAAAQAA